ncbi:prolipoprotein diacylglyceryl transferase family protein [Treponema sp. UBA3813]|uniref:prolipoprotein diacylglyceryl transferase n=1 Tax=Treponema sp. UBA3813 TaxID=1947715 RepID=UPI0025D09139|nr:prolipoprotein diacylglyceryl transferase family protein [Treponema sp. UBA3813]
MFPEIHFFNLIIPMYPLCVATGFLIGTAVLYLFAYKCDFPEKLVFPLMCFIELAVILGGKILFLLINIHNLTKIFEKFGFIAIFTKTGFVFYGGLFGGFIAVLVFSKIYKISLNEILPLVISVTPLIHAFGRIGCLFVGCCYGIEYDGFCSVRLHGVNRFPVQLLESTMLLVLFVVLQVFLYKSRNRVPFAYFLGYGTLRFFCEFLRGDESRGFIGQFSVSAWISLIIFVVTFIACFVTFFTQLSKNRVS